MNNSKSSLFLMELIIVILFFSIASAVCVQLFFSSHTIDMQTKEQTHANIYIQNLSECFYAYNGNPTDIVQHYTATAANSKNECFIALDDSWNTVDTNSISGNIEDSSISYIVFLNTNFDTKDNESGYFVNGTISAYKLTDLYSTSTNLATTDIFDSISYSDISPISEQSITTYVQYRKEDIDAN